MKATFDIPDDLYRHVKARSALEGRPLRSVVLELFQHWLNQPTKSPSPPPAGTQTGWKPTRFDTAPWARIARPYIRQGMSHDWDAMREIIAEAWGKEGSEKPGSPKKRR